MTKNQSFLICEDCQHNTITYEPSKKRVLTVVKKTSADMKERTGVEASMDEGDMKDYVELVIKELRRK